MKPGLVRKALRAAAAFMIAAAMLVAVVPSASHAGLIYDYVGNNFTPRLSSGIFQTGINITGFVEFAAQPAPGGTFDATDVVAFSFTAGPVTINNLNARSTSFLFEFDQSPSIVNWLWVISTVPSPVFPQDELLFSCGFLSPTVACGQQFGLDGASIPAPVQTSGQVVNEPGTWTKRAVAAPEPGTLWLLLAGLAALALVQRRAGDRGRAGRLAKAS